MKARINATGEIVDIEDMSMVSYKSSDGTYVGTLLRNFTFIDADKDYYTKLEHQYAGMAMQGILSNKNLVEDISRYDIGLAEGVAKVSKEMAITLVEKYKGKEERK